MGVAIDRSDLSSAIKYVIGCWERHGGVSISLLWAALHDVEGSVTKLAVVEEVDRLLADGQIRRTGAKRTGDQRFHVATERSHP